MIAAFRMSATRELRALVELVLTDPAALESMPERQRCREWRDELFERFKAGTVFPYVPMDVSGDVPVPQGLYWGDVCGAGVAFGHQFVLPAARRGMNAVLCVKVCAVAFLEDFPCVSLLMGLTPVGNAAAQAVALRAGFRDKGPVRVDGVVCRLLVAERGKFL